MRQIQAKGKRPVAFLAVGDLHASGLKRLGNTPPPTADLEKVAGRTKDERALLHGNVERHADTKADVLLQSRWPAKPLGRRDGLGKAAGPSVDACPGLSAEVLILGDADEGRAGSAIGERQG